MKYGITLLTILTTTALTGCGGPSVTSRTTTSASTTESSLGQGQAQVDLSGDLNESITFNNNDFTHSVVMCSMNFNRLHVSFAETGMDRPAGGRSLQIEADLGYGQNGGIIQVGRMGVTGVLDSRDTSLVWSNSNSLCQLTISSPTVSPGQILYASLQCREMTTVGQMDSSYFAQRYKQVVRLHSNFSCQLN